MTISETGERRGFTLIEILLTLALVALLGSIFIGGSTALLDSKAASPEDQFWKACAQARKEALQGGRTVVLTFDPKQHAFVVNDAGNLTTIAVTASDDLVIDFHPPASEASASILIGGTLVETQPLLSVDFYNDGTCTPFRVQLREKGGAHLLSIDPWTCAPVLNKSDATL